jgi:glutamate dehydrogenase
MVYSFGLLDVVETATQTGCGTDEVAQIYFTLSERFEVDGLLSRISMLPREDRWQTLARMALRYDLYAALAALTTEVLAATPSGQAATERVLAWEERNANSISRARNALRDLGEARTDLASLSVMLRQIRTLVRQAGAS